MVKTIEFESNKPLDLLKEESRIYFQKQGFRLANEGENTLDFKRGSYLTNLVAFNPLKWKSSITVVFTEAGVSAHFDINTIFQLVLPKEDKLWEKFVLNFQLTLDNSEDFTLDNQTELNNTLKSSYRFTGFILLGAVVFWIPSIAIAHFTGIDSIGKYGGIFGAAAFASYRMFKEENGT